MSGKMSLLANSLLEISDADEHQEIVRVLHLDRARNSVHLIRIDRSDALPQERKLSVLEGESPISRFAI